MHYISFNIYNSQKGYCHWFLFCVLCSMSIVYSVAFLWLSIHYYYYYYYLWLQAILSGRRSRLGQCSYPETIGRNSISGWNASRVSRDTQLYVTQFCVGIVSYWNRAWFVASFTLLCFFLLKDTIFRIVLGIDIVLTSSVLPENQLLKFPLQYQN